jgi:antitoxin component YwqK of YwqJK toxin-antitoxin module
MRTLIVVLTFVSINIALYSQTQDTAKIKIDHSSLHGYHTTFNKYGQKSKVGTFKDNMLVNGKTYVYDEKGILQSIKFYKDSKNVRDSTIK